MTHPITNPNIQKIQEYGSGSYLASDVTVLLDIVDKNAVTDVPVSQKKRSSKVDSAIILTC